MTQGIIKVKTKTLDKYIEEAGFTRDSFSKRIHFDKSNFNKMVNNQMEPSKPLIKRLLTYTGYQWDALFEFDRFPKDGGI